MKTLWGREPAALIAFAQALLTLAVAFGLSLSDEQLGAVMAAVALGLGLLTRSQVSPAGAVPKPAGELVDAAGQPVAQVVTTDPTVIDEVQGTVISDQGDIVGAVGPLDEDDDQ